MSGTFLDKIVSAKRRRVEEARRRCDTAQLCEAAFQRRKNAAPNRLAEALKPNGRVNIIAEIKRASPSKGNINESIDAADLAGAYRRGGARAISVLTEEDHFRGSLDDLKKVRSAVNLPILQKDFFIDEFQVLESAAAGADAILLIVAALPMKRLSLMQKAANDLGMDAIVEVHNLDELRVACEIEAAIIGVNNRSLKTFDVSLDVSLELADSVRNDALLISESGVSDVGQIAELRDLGYSGFLIGESLMRSGDPEAKLRELTAIENQVP